jgi:hypothetical protein
MRILSFKSWGVNLYIKGIQLSTTSITTTNMSKHPRDAATDLETSLEKRTIKLSLPSTPEGCPCLSCELCKEVEERIDRALQILRGIEVKGEDVAWAMDPTPSDQTEARLLRLARARAAHAEFSVRTACFEIFPMGRYGCGVDLIVRSLRGSYWSLKSQCGDDDDTDCDDDDSDAHDKARTSADIFQRSVSLLQSHLYRCAAAIKEARQPSYDEAISVRGNIAFIVLGACQGLHRNKNALSDLLAVFGDLRRTLNMLKNVKREPSCTMVRPNPAPVLLDGDDTEVDEPLPTSLASQDPGASTEADAHDQLP